MTPEQLIALLHGSTSPQSPFRMGTVAALLSTGWPTITFDGEVAASVRGYPYLGAYTPHAGDRVLLAVVGSSYVVLGKVT